MREGLWGPAARYRLHKESPRPLGGQASAGWRACAAGLGDGVGVGLSRAGLRGVAQTPQVWYRVEGEPCSRPILQGLVGQVRGGPPLGVQG